MKNFVTKFDNFMERTNSDFRPRWRHRWIHHASLNNVKKGNNKFKNKKQPELPKN